MTRRYTILLVLVPSVALAAVDAGSGEGETKVRAARPAADSRHHARHQKPTQL